MTNPGIDPNAPAAEIQAYLRGKHSGERIKCGAVQCLSMATYRCLEGSPSCVAHRSACCHLVNEPQIALLHDTLRVILGYGEVDPHRVSYSDTAQTYVAQYQVRLVTRDAPLEREAFWEQVLEYAEGQLVAIRKELHRG